MIMNVPKLTHSEPLFKQCGVMSIQNRVKFRSACLVFKTINGLCPAYMDNMFIPVSTRSSRTTRNSSDHTLLFVPRKDLCVSRRTIRYSGTIVFNALCRDIRESQSLAGFKNRAYKHFMQF